MFLKECARRLDDGVPARVVLDDMERRYTTPQCLSVKTSIVRNMCRPSKMYADAVEKLRDEFPDKLEDIRQGKSSDDELQSRLRCLPFKWDDNVYALRPTRKEMKECKRANARNVLERNRCRKKVQGRELLAMSRRILETPEAHSLPDLVCALLLCTGRRTCEILNGSSVFTVEDTYTLVFDGLAKQRHGGVQLVIPVLAPARVVHDGIEQLRARQKKTVLTNAAASRRYQSLLSRHLAAHAVWKQCRRVHGLRGIYACIVLRLFEWDENLSDAYVSMSVLGHSSLQESLAYTTYHLGNDFGAEPSLGVGRVTPRQSLPDGRITLIVD